MNFRGFLIGFAVVCLAGSGWAQEFVVNPDKNTFGPMHRFVFFAVLEGCFNDGLTMEDIDLIIPTREDKKDRRRITTNLVYTCPLCSPSFDAFRLYSDRRIFISGMTKDAIYNTFGPGLNEEVKAELKKPGLPCRNAIQGLIQKWVNERIVSQRLTAQEEKALRAKLAKMSEEGEAALKKLQTGEHGEELQNNYKDWEQCPVCRGASPMGGAR